MNYHRVLYAPQNNTTTHNFTIQQQHVQTYSQYQPPSNLEESIVRPTSFYRSSTHR